MRLPILTLFLGALLFATACVHQPKPATPAGNYLNDLVLYEQILRATHAGLYNYHSKAQVDSIFDHYNILVGKETLDRITFYKYVCTITAWIGSLHDDVFLPDEVRDSIRRQKGFFPYPVRIVHDSLVINIDHQIIPAGAGIVSINGHTAAELITSLGRYYTTDGYNTTGKKPGIDHYFSWYYALEYGTQAAFKVRYKPYGSVEELEETVQPVTYATAMAQYKQRHSLPLDTLQDDDYHFQWANAGKTAVLTVNTFGLGNAESGSHKAYSRFLDSVFRLLETRHTQSLVVDVRRNGGGDDPNDLLSFSYLAYQPFKENKEAYTIFQRLPFKQYYLAEDSSDIPDLESNFLEEHSQLADGKYYQQPSFNPAWQPDKHAFRGKAYLLVGPRVASAASLFASMVRSEGKVTVIGEETMGGYYGHTGHNSVLYQLPDSRIAFQLSVVNVKQYVQPRADIPPGRGIMPDIDEQQDVRDFIDNRDRVLEHALGLAAGLTP
ncbi:peptidase S41 [Chitinophaga agrisoli]|uniref:Peptidase S41 n=1 Tax=Chitinophaga agrisoli TaxID=2607653 RepID=A0A5B2VN81_9BACT|nr:S41 family peptidase [Chitinophaga agrisoli]KAA2240158.1 peptidase S41 [Chitinophaga agrisoli]